MDIKRKSYSPHKPAPVLSSKAIKDFQNVYFLEFGVHLTSRQAQTNGLRFLQFMKNILKPIPMNIEKKDYGK